METIAAARDLGTWATPVRPSHENKENMYSAATATASAAAAAAAAAYRCTNTPLPHYTPLAEFPNGRGGGRRGDAYSLSAATAAASSPAAVATGAASPVGWRGYRWGGGDAKEICVGGSSGRPRGYQRSSSDVAASAAMCRGGFGATPAPRGGVRGGVDRGGRGGVSGRRRGSAAAPSAGAAADDMHLAAAAVARARRGRLSSRF